MSKVYQVITDRVIAALEKGTAGVHGPGVSCLVHRMPLPLSIPSIQLLRRVEP